MNQKLDKFLGFIKNVIYNFRFFKFDIAIKMPLQVSFKTIIRGARRGAIEINVDKGNIKRNMISIGICRNERIIGDERSYLSISKKGILKFSGDATFSIGNSISVFDNGVMSFGQHFFANNNVIFGCCDSISFGNDVIVGYQVEFRDGDGHYIYRNNCKKNERKPIVIGNHVWICSHVIVYKGSVLPNGCVLAGNSVLNKEIFNENSIVGGYPAKELSNDINWIK